MNVPGGGGGAVNNILPPELVLGILKYQDFEAADHIRQLQGQKEQFERGVSDRDSQLHNYLIPGLLKVHKTISLSIKLQKSGSEIGQETVDSLVAMNTAQLILRELLRNGYGIHNFDSGVAHPGCIHVFLDYLTEGMETYSGAQLLSDFAGLACNLLYAIQYTHASLQFGPLHLTDLQPGSVDGAKWGLMDDAQKMEVQAVRRQGTHVRIAGANLAGGLLPPATIYVRERGKLHSTIPQEAWRVFKTSANVKGNQDGEVSEVEFQLDHLGSRSERTLEIVRHGYKGVVTLGVQRSEQVPAAFKSAGEGEAGKEAGSSDEREGLAQEVTRKASLAEDRSVEEKLWSEQQKAKTKSPIDDGDMGKGSKEALEQTEVAEEKGDIKSPAGAPINVPAADRQGKPVAEMMELLAVLAPTAISQSSHSTHGDAEHGRPALLQTPQSSREGWLIDHSDLEFATDATGWPIYLGRGALGTVYRGILAKSREVAIKALMFEVQESLEAALQEVDILIKLEHPNIVQFIGATPMDKCLLLVMEPMAGNLYHALNNDKCTWHKGGKDVALEIASALAFMHGNGVMHLDVKSFNVLLTSGNHAKLGGLGMCNMAGRESFIRSSESRGAQAWASPEMIAGEAVTLASDVYSFGVLLWEICTGEVPIRPLRAVNHEAGPQNEAPPKVVFLIDRCLAANPGDRPKMQEVYEVLKGF